VIGPDGAAVPCCYCEEEVLGNIFDDGFRAVWRGAKYQDLRRRMLAMPKTGRPICGECFTNCNRAQENLHVYGRIHPLRRGAPRVR
jgi:MoaA/NifB/PqqE/SkfB family radical SAM enzyme